MNSTGRGPTHSTAAGDTRLAEPLPTPRLGELSGPLSTPGTASVPSPASTLEARNARDRRWVDWRRQMGRRLRALRELTGLSQARLARIVGTNQAALSRLEAGKGVVPLSLVVRLGPALAANLIDPAVLSDEGNRLLSALQTLAPSGLEQWLPVTRDPDFHELVRRYLCASEPQRKVVLAVVGALGAGGPPRSR